MAKILYYSTNHQSEKATFSQALLKGLAPDRGLYMPDSIPVVSHVEISEFGRKPYYEIAFDIISRFIQDAMPPSDLYNLVKDAYNFDVPLEHVVDRHYFMRLDRGPTASFKDFAARLMGRLMQYFLRLENRKMTILTATSGDTGSAIANAFYDLDHIQVVILYPEAEVTERQRKQMTTLHKNITVLSIDGKFDDCQAMVKQAFSDRELDHLGLSSANSINIGRLLPQSVYYFYAFSRLARDVNDQPIFSVPSGNLGDLMGGLIAQHMGLPVKKFVISTNANNEIPQYFMNGVYKIIVPSVHSISSAMNVGHPSNMARMIDLYGGIMDEKGKILKEPDISRLHKDMVAVSVTDKETRDTIKDVYKHYDILIEPHGAVGWAGLLKYLSNATSGIDPDQLTVTFETAHPAKFPKEINDILSMDPELPPSMAQLNQKEEEYVPISNDYKQFKEYLTTNFK